MVNHKENHLCELFITGMYTKPYWYGFSFECGMSTNLPSLVAAILCYAAERTFEGFIHILSVLAAECIYISHLNTDKQESKITLS